MRNISYKKQSYRLSDEVAKLIKEKKEDSGLSYNLFFKQLLTAYEESTTTAFTEN